MNPAFLFAPVILIVAVWVLFVFAQISRRRREMGEWAAHNGWTFDPDRSDFVDMDYAGLSCLIRGDNRYSYNRVKGSFKDKQFDLFDYHYETGSKDSDSNSRAQSHVFSAVVMQCPFPLKPLLIRPEGLFDKMKQFLGFEDINFESAEFSRKFFVKANDKRWAYDVIHQRVMELLLSSPMHCMEMNDLQIIVWNDRTYTVAEFQDALYFLDRFIDLFPDYLIRQQMESLAIPNRA